MLGGGTVVVGGNSVVVGAGVVGIGTSKVGLGVVVGSSIRTSGLKVSQFMPKWVGSQRQSPSSHVPWSPQPPGQSKTILQFGDLGFALQNAVAASLLGPAQEGCPGHANVFCGTGGLTITAAGDVSIVAKVKAGRCLERKWVDEAPSEPVKGGCVGSGEGSCHAFAMWSGIGSW